MHITLTLDDDLAEALNRSARLAGRTFNDVVNASIRRGLATSDQAADSGTEPFVVQPQACSLMSGIDRLRPNQLVDQLEVEQFMAAQMPEGQAP